MRDQKIYFFVMLLPIAILLFLIIILGISNWRSQGKEKNNLLDKKIQQIEKTNNFLQARVNTHDLQIESLDVSVDAHDAEIAEIITTISDSAVAITTVEKEVTDLSGDMANLQKDQNKLFLDVADVQKQTRELRQKVNGLKTITFRSNDAVKQLSEDNELLVAYVTGFDLGKATLSKKGQEQLSDLFQQLRTGKYEVFCITGFADSSPSSENQKYGLQRATLINCLVRREGIPVLCNSEFGDSTDRYGDPEMNRCVRIFARKIRKNTSEELGEKVLSDVTSPRISPSRERRIERRDAWKKNSW